MFRADSVRPVTDFSRKPAEHIKRLKETGEPELLTLNGKAALVIQDAYAYEEMANLIHSLRQIAKSAKEFDAGKDLSAEEVFQKIEKKYGLQREKIQS